MTDAPTRRYDLIVVGAGPAGAEAALTAAAHGLSVLLLDEADAAGGQVYRAPLGTEQEATPGHRLRKRLAESAVTCGFGHSVWHARRATTTGFSIFTVRDTGTQTFEASAVVLAMGTVERCYPRPGWTLPGVVGLAAASVMLKAARVLPGRNVVVCGPGPLGPLVANLILQGGGQVQALVDPNPRAAWLACIPEMLRQPRLLAQGAGLLGGLLAHGVPVYRGWDVVQIFGEHQVQRVSIAAVDRAWKPLGGILQRVIEADSVCLGYGLTPATELCELLGAELSFASGLGGWVPRLSEYQQTSVPGLYAAGDGAGVRGANAAALSGRLSGLCAARGLNRLEPAEFDTAVQPVARALAKSTRFGTALGRLCAVRETAVAHLAADTVVCRCEDVTVAELCVAIAEGATQLNALKAVTRCGMGPCGGRICGESAAALLHCAGVSREQAGRFTPRPPLRPLPIQSLIGEFEYSDIPFPEPSPP